MSLTVRKGPSIIRIDISSPELSIWKKLHDIKIAFAKLGPINIFLGGGMQADFLRYSTRHVATRLKVDSWDEHASAVITGLHVEPARGIAFEASFKAVEFAGIGFIEAISTPTRVVHLQSARANDRAPAYLIHIQLRGTCVNRQAQTEVLLNPGDFVLCDNTLPCELMLDGENHMLVLRIPQATLKRRIPTPELYINHLMRGDRGSGLLASRFASLFWMECQSNMTASSAERAADSVCDLLATALIDTGCAALDHSTVQTLWKLRIRRFIDVHLGDSALTPGLIARKFRISARYLHKLFANEDEAVSRYILRRRLESCHRDLSDIHQFTKTVSSIAFTWGFNNTTHFARVFRERYGLSPSDFRRQLCPVAKTS